MDVPKPPKNPQSGLPYEFFPGCNVPAAARSYVREVAAIKGFTEARALGLIILEHKLAAGKPR